MRPYFMAVYSWISRKYDMLEKYVRGVQHETCL